MFYAQKKNENSAAYQHGSRKLALKPESFLFNRQSIRSTIKGLGINVHSRVAIARCSSASWSCANFFSGHMSQTIDRRP
jgi:hypothetical protein